MGDVDWKRNQHQDFMPVSSQSLLPNLDGIILCESCLPVSGIPICQVSYNLSWEDVCWYHFNLCNTKQLSKQRK